MGTDQSRLVRNPDRTANTLPNSNVFSLRSVWLAIMPLNHPLTDEIKSPVFYQESIPVTQVSTSTICLIPEWAEQSAVLLAWPYAEGDFSRWLPAVEETYGAIASAVACREILIIACRSETHRDHIRAILAARSVDAGQVRYAILPYDDVWVRDTAPLAVGKSETVRLYDFRFNGWGGKYAHAADARFAENLHATGLLGTMPMSQVDFVLEGGSVESDGAGTLMTTSRCLLNPNRNPALSREQIEARLRADLGAEKILWLEHGYAEGDDTDAHIDTLARFCSPDTIAYTACDRIDDPLYRELEIMAEQLRTFTSVSGQSYRLIPLPIPRPIYSEEGDRLPATYANFLIINGAVLVPVYDDPADIEALERLAACFPGREIIAIDCIPLIRQYGSLHCMTMQFPKTVGVS
jgi:agmatine/peptidylarginine deiminase